MNLELKIRKGSSNESESWKLSLLSRPFLSNSLIKFQTLQMNSIKQERINGLTRRFMGDIDILYKASQLRVAHAEGGSGELGKYGRIHGT